MLGGGRGSTAVRYCANCERVQTIGCEPVCATSVMATLTNTLVPLVVVNGAKLPSSGQPLIRHAVVAVADELREERVVALGLNDQVAERDLAEVDRGAVRGRRIAWGADALQAEDRGARIHREELQRVGRIQAAICVTLSPIVVGEVGAV